MRTYLSPLLLTLVSLSISYAQDTTWIKKSQTDEVTVFYRKVPDAKVNEIKVETEVEASLSSIIAVLRDIKAYPDWIYNCISAERLPEATAETNYYYSEINFPWPLSNRDFIAKSHLSQDPETKIIEIKVEGVPDMLPKQKRNVRIPEMEINWKISPLGDDRVHISYHLYSDPGGSIPSWLINMFIDQGPRHTLEDLRKMLEKDKYQEIHFADIQE